MALKAKSKTPPGDPKYHRLTDEKRIIIETLRKEKRSTSYIALQIGCSKSTVSEEIRRNRSKKGYQHKKANGMARARMSAKAARRRRLTEAMWREALEKLALGWTFAMVCGRAKKDGRVFVCAEMLYKEYYRRQRLVALGKSKESLPSLPRAGRKRHRRGKSYKEAGRGRIPNRVDIDTRPEAVENRGRGGHWEGDLINGLHGTGNLVTIAERMTRFTIFDYVGSKETDVVMGATVGLLGSLPEQLRQTLTFDNGKEFAKFQQLVQALGLDVYFAHPYHLWELGTNENRNGVVRKVLPKGTSFTHLTAEQIRRIDYLLNDRPMKCLNWRTPREAFNQLLRRALATRAA